MFLMHHSRHCPLLVGRMLFKLNNASITRKTITTSPITSNVFNIGKRMRNEQYYKKLDKMEPTYELIYRAPFEYLAPMCKHVPTFNLIFVSSLIAYKYAVGIEIIDKTAQYVVGPVMADGAELTAFLYAFYVVNVAVAYAVTKYPLRIYKLKNQYCAMFEGYLPLRPRPYRFQKGDVRETKSILPWHESIYKMKDRTVLVFSHHFKRPGDFNDML